MIQTAGLLRLWWITRKFQVSLTIDFDLKTIICLRISEVIIERISVCKVIEKLMEHSIHCLPCSYTNDIIDLLPKQL